MRERERERFKGIHAVCTSNDDDGDGGDFCNLEKELLACSLDE